jgi:serine/threonine-protein kinase
VVTAERPPLRPPEFVLGNALGEGGTALVHLATQTSLAREVAVKSLKPEVFGLDAGQRLVDEAMITGALEHPGIVPVYALGHDAEGRPFMVMKRVEGVSWAQMIASADHPHWATLGLGPDGGHTAGDGPPETDRLEWHLRVLAQVASAVHFAHKRGVIHRDLKPDNVMIGTFGEVYVLDWGLAVRLDDRGAPPAGDDALVVGTPGYMPPEMVSGELPAQGVHTDVYLLGAMLHEVLTGEPPHLGSPSEALLSALRSEARTYGPGVPRELAEIARRAMSRDPLERHASALVFRHRLERYLRHRGELLLTEAAVLRLEELERTLDAVAEGSAPAVDDRVIQRLFAECQFGFRHVLRTAGHHPAASRGLQRCLERMAAHELGQGRTDRASSLLAEVDHPPVELGQRVAEAHRLEQQRALELGTLRRAALDRDLRAGSKARSLTAVACGLVFVVVAAWFRLFSGLPTGAEREVAVGAGLLLVMLVFGALGHRHLFTNRASRRLGVALAAALGFVLLQRVLGLITRPAATTLLAHDLLLVAASSAIAAIVFDRRLAPVPVWFIAAAFALGAWPQASLLIMPCAVMGGAGLLALGWLMPPVADGPAGHPAHRDS